LRLHLRGMAGGDPWNLVEGAVDARWVDSASFEHPRAAATGVVEELAPGTGGEPGIVPVVSRPGGEPGVRMPENRRTHRPRTAHKHRRSTAGAGRSPAVGAYTAGATMRPAR
jgi:hypothetical protein